MPALPEAAQWYPPGWWRATDGRWYPPEAIPGSPTAERPSVVASRLPVLISALVATLGSALPWAQVFTSS
jgi:hypothetical protein